MKIDKAHLNSIVDRFAGTRVLTIGDLILDHYTWGKVDRISPEAPVVVVSVTKENKRLGGAGNVVSNIASLGAHVDVCGVIGDDETGREVLAQLEVLGCDSEGIVIDSSRPTTSKNRVIAHSQQVVRVDREIAAPLSRTLQVELAERVGRKLEKSAAVVVSDYAKGAIGVPVFSKLKEGYQQGRLGAGKVPLLVDPKAPNFSIYSCATIIKPNRKEAEEASSIPISSRQEAIQAGNVLLERWGSEMILITLGELGMVLVSQVPGSETNVEIDTVAREVFDVSGAGDTVSAVFALALAVNSTPRDAAILANLAAGVVVGEVGTVSITVKQIRAAIAQAAALEILE